MAIEQPYKKLFVGWLFPFPDLLVPAPAGVRAQAIRRDGTMVDDFLFARSERMVHVINAPSPAATAALNIAELICDEVAAIR